MQRGQTATHQNSPGKVDGGELENRLQPREGVHFPPLLLHLDNPPHHHVPHLPNVPDEQHTIQGNISSRHHLDTGISNSEQDRARPILQQGFLFF